MRSTSFSELPDFAAADFDPARLEPNLKRYGAVLLRGLLPAQSVIDWLPAFEAGFAAFDELYRRGEMDAASQRNLYVYGHTHPKCIQNYPAWIDRQLTAPLIRPLLAAYFGKRAYLLQGQSSPRRQLAAHAERSIGFHQDHEFMGPMSRALNFWLPLTPAGGEWPGLEIWLGSPQHPLLSFAQSAADREQALARMPAEALWRPELGPGDALILTHYTIHRTLLTPEMRHTRISSEMRLISADDIWLARSPLIVCELGDGI